MEFEDLDGLGLEYYIGLDTLTPQNQKTAQSLPAWFSAAQNNDVTTLKRLQDKCFKTTQGRYKWTALMYAAFNNSEEAVKFLLSRESGIQDNDGITALMLAAVKGYTNIVKLLIPKEAGMFLPYDTLEFPKGATALLMAAQQNHKSTVQILFPAEGKLSHFTHFHLFAVLRDVNQLLMLGGGENGGIKDAPDLLGRTALSYAFAGKDDGALQLDVIKALGVGGNQPDAFGRSPLHYAVMADNMSVIQELQVQQEQRSAGGSYRLLQYVSISNTRPTRFVEMQAQRLNSAQRPVKYGKLTKAPLYSRFALEMTPLMLACAHNARRLAPRLMSQYGGRAVQNGVTALMLSTVFDGPIAASLFRLEGAATLRYQLGPLPPGSNVFDVAMTYGSDSTIQMLNKCRDDALDFGQQSQRWKMVEGVLRTQVENPHVPVANFEPPEASGVLGGQIDSFQREMEESQQKQLQSLQKQPSNIQDTVNTRGSISIQELRQQQQQQEIYTHNNVETLPIQSLITEQQIDYAKELLMQYLQTDEKLKGLSVEEILVKLSDTTQSSENQQKLHQNINNTQSIHAEQLNTNFYVDQVTSKSTGQNLGSSGESENLWTINQELQNNFNDIHYLQQFALQADQKIHRLEARIAKRDKQINRQLVEIKEQIAVNRNLQAQVDELDILVQQLDAV